MNRSFSFFFVTGRVGVIAGVLALALAMALDGRTPAFGGGVALSFGSNTAGATGLNVGIGNTLVAAPIDKTCLADESIVQVSAGYYFSLALCDDGTVYSFGWNEYGKTGLGIDTGSTLVATAIDTTNLAGRVITQVSAGREHGLLLADDGTVFAIGFNGFGQAGLGMAATQALVATPIDMTNLAGREVTQVAAGFDHSLLLTDDGAVFSFGYNSAGQTGWGLGIAATVATPIDATNLDGRKVTQIAANHHSLLLADDGTVFSFGLTREIGLGLDDDGYTTIATPIDTTNLTGMRVTGISSGQHHSLLLAVPVPEPGGVVLVVIGGVLLVALRRHP